MTNYRSGRAMLSSRKHSKISKRVVVAVVAILLACIVGGYLFFTQNPSATALAADNILRPIFGEKTTIAIESVYFAVSEEVKRIKYTFVQPDSNLFISDNSVPYVQPAKNGATDNLALTSIPIKHNFPPLTNEGVWEVLPQPLFPNQVVMARTVVRPDPTRSYASVALVEMNMKKLGIGVEAGIKYPGGTLGIEGPGFVPMAIQKANILVAVFNGGFQEKDGHYGMVVGDKIYVPLRTGLATIFMYADGSFKMSNYQGGAIDKNVISIRQNGPLLIEDGNITPFVEGGVDTWGRTTTSSMFTWRSGLGVTKEGNLIYAVGQSLHPRTLAQALLSAGAVNAMQLDINPFWVRFFAYTPLGNGDYTSIPMLKEIKTGGYDYLHGYQKDFFFVYKK